MQITLDIPDVLGQRLEAYLESHPNETVFSLIEQLLEIKLMPKDSSQLLTLAGIVDEAPLNARDRAEDEVA
ncbi:hypothetical protein [Leptolyngbya ohadii]|uniref:hypothetical protein n=1 Tax=Leptolyngbya ohadii TaxID=1962290 RepID=UPI000B59C9D6|nr:hypothetical protein [Leptolyngbya ohadii]